MSLTFFRARAVLSLAGLLVVVAAAISADPLRAEDPQSDPTVADAAAGAGGPQYPLGGHIIWRQHDDGRVEFCFEPTGQERVCPYLRFIRPERLRTDRWTPSSEIAWSVPLDPQRIVLPPAISQQTGSCDADLDRMFAATWKVETIRWLGSAFHIGGGRFVTAHHVIDDVPPVVVLTHGDRAVPAAVLGSDPEHDVALLEAFDPLEILDVPSVAFRDPTPSDVGEPVYLVGYPSAGALTAATGVITRVWEDEILTNSSSRGGNSGGPMFDACGNVIGVLWAGSPASNLSHSGEVLRATLEGLDQPPPALPALPPGIVIPDGVVIWHYGPEPPADVDCVGVEGEWWVGVAGDSSLWIEWGEPSTGQCGYGSVTVIAFRQAPDTAGDQSWRVEIEPPAPGDQIEQRARIAFRANPSGAGTESCLLFEDGALACPSRAASQGGPGPAGWQRSGALIWHAALGQEHAPERTRCALTVDLGDLAWQVSALGGDGSALYAGRSQFITASGLFSDEIPWGVISQGAIALPVARVATDARNGLALVEVIGPAPALGPHLQAPFAPSTAETADSEPVLVAYPWGEADRFAMTRLRVTEVTDRLLRHNGWGWDRAGAPIVDPCSRQVLGISTGSSEALRVETVAAALGELRRQRVPPQAPAQGPELHGSIALLPMPVYLSTEQPDIGGGICNVRPSTRFDVVYTVYLVSAASSELGGVVDGQWDWASRCGWGGKIFIVEYRSDQVPSHFCAEPWSPQSPRSTIDLSLVAPPGTELLQATEFNRWHCPGLPASDYWANYWASTHFVRLRFPQLAEFDDITIQLEDASGRLNDPVGRSGDVDPDVGAWRFNLDEAEPVRLIVSIPEQATDVPPPGSADQEQETDPACVEDLGPTGYGLVSATLHRARIPIGEVEIVRYGAPLHCPWFHTHGVFVTFGDPVPKAVHLGAALIAADGSVLEGHWSGDIRYGRGDPDVYTSFQQAFEVPEDFEPRAAEIRVGARRWIVIIGETGGN